MWSKSSDFMPCDDHAVEEIFAIQPRIERLTRLWPLAVEFVCSSHAYVIFSGFPVSLLLSTDMQFG